MSLLLRNINFIYIKKYFKEFFPILKVIYNIRKNNEDISVKKVPYFVTLTYFPEFLLYSPFRTATTQS